MTMILILILMVMVMVMKKKKKKTWPQWAFLLLRFSCIIWSKKMVMVFPSLYFPFSQSESVSLVPRLCSESKRPVQSRKSSNTFLESDWQVLIDPTLGFDNPFSRMSQSLWSQGCSGAKKLSPIQSTLVFQTFFGFGQPILIDLIVGFNDPFPKPKLSFLIDQH